MIEIEPSAETSFVTFEIVYDKPVSVVGSFNGWDPLVHPLVTNDRGFRWVTVELPPGRYEFRYLSDGGEFFDEDENDLAETETNGIGGTHSVFTVEPSQAWEDTPVDTQSNLI
jgi:1,4-alpha-glucan branching enzyme